MERGGFLFFFSFLLGELGRRVADLLFISIGRGRGTKKSFSPFSMSSDRGNANPESSTARPTLPFFSLPRGGGIPHADDAYQISSLSPHLLPPRPPRTFSLLPVPWREKVRYCSLFSPSRQKRNRGDFYLVHEDRGHFPLLFRVAGNITRPTRGKPPSLETCVKKEILLLPLLAEELHVWRLLLFLPSRKISLPFLGKGREGFPLSKRKGTLSSSRNAPGITYARSGVFPPSLTPTLADNREVLPSSLFPQPTVAIAYGLVDISLSLYN